MRPVPPVAPGVRLPDTVTPLAYDLSLELDPDSEEFRGEVTIEVRLERATDIVWLHADELTIASATWAHGTLTPLALHGEQMHAFSFGRVVAAGTTTLHFTYSGRTTGDQEGLFRQRDGAWYLYTQGESVFARRITPCFDEPRWKTPWRVSVVVPRRDVALANAAETATVDLPGGRKRVTFAETAPLPSYLLALAVGPFDVIDAGTVGRNKIPLRVAVTGHRTKRAGVAAARLPQVVHALETYLDDPLPVAKLDLVGVPAFFGAMENPGLITFHEPILVGDARDQTFANYFTYIAAHEIAHQWFGNSVTPAWWDHLWLSEAFASWLGDKIVRELGAYDDAPLRFALARRDAIEADRAIDAKPLWRHVTTNIDADAGFDAIAYAKGQLVLATFESYVGASTFRDRVRAYLRAERGRSVTSEELVSRLGIPGLQAIAATAGTPVVDLALRCSPSPVVIAHARTVKVPICIAYGANQRACALAADATQLGVGPSCPKFLRGNPDGGYYHTAWTTNGPRGPSPPVADLDPASRIIAGDDLAAAVQRGELPAAQVVAQLRELTATRDPYAQLGALGLARAVDAVVDDATRPAWTAFLAARFATTLASDKRPKQPADAEVFNALVALLPTDRFAPALAKRASELVDTRFEPRPGAVALAAQQGADKLFDRIVDRVLVVRDDDVRDAWIEALGDMPAAQIDKAIGLVLRGELPFETSWLAVARYLSRPATRLAAWQAVHAALPEIEKRMAPDDRHDVLAAIAHLCDTTSRGEVAAAFAAYTELPPTLAMIDRCIEQRAKLGDLAGALP
jgi:alanyl aminopeptidase